MKLVYASDLHGNLDFYRQLLDLAVAADARIAILGGDLLPRALRRATAIEEQLRFVREQLAPLLRDHRQRDPRFMLYTIPGNDDWAAAYVAITELEVEGLLVNVHGRVVELAPNVWLAGSGLVGLTPFAIKDYERRDLPDEPPARFAQALRSDRGVIEPYDSGELLAQPSVAEELARLAQRSDPSRTIYTLHAPPWETQLDRRTGGAPTGSRAVRDFIQRYAPPLTLHGHIHESPAVSGAWLEQIGRTIAINPGQAQRGFHAVALDTADPLRTARHTVYGSYRR